MLVLLPLWSSYVVRVYAWRVILFPAASSTGSSRALGLPSLSPGFWTRRCGSSSSYLWLPYMILPIFAGLERIPRSLLEASADLGGRQPDDLPGIVAAARPAGPRRRLDLHVLA